MTTKITLNQLDDDVQAAIGGGGAPIGAVYAWAVTDIPVGFLECNGATISNITNPELAELVELLNPGQTTAVLPDLRGEFIRGFDNGKGTDVGRMINTFQADEVGPHTHPDVGSASASVDHTHAAGSLLGPQHQHIIFTLPNVGVGAGPVGNNIPIFNNPSNVNLGDTSELNGNLPVTGATAGQSATHEHTVSTPASIGVETRPRNVALMFIIKSSAPIATLTPPANLFDLVYPVGSVYTTFAGADPAALFGGTWVQLGEGEFLMNTVAGAEPTGGSNDQGVPLHNHGLNFDALAGHTHTMTARGATPAQTGPLAFSGDTTSAIIEQPSSSVSAGTPSTAGGSNVSNNTGDSVANMNRPLFKGVAIWERTA